MASHDEFTPDTVDQRLEQLSGISPRQAVPADRDDAALIQALRRIYHVSLSEADRASLEHARQRIAAARMSDRRAARQAVPQIQRGRGGPLVPDMEQRKRSTVMRTLTSLAAALVVAVLVGSWFLVIHTTVNMKHQPPQKHPSSQAKSAAGTSTASAAMFPPSIYPLPHAPIGKGSISFPSQFGQFTCPSLNGLQVPSSGVKQGILASLNGLLFARSELQAQTYADRAAWPIIAAGWATPGSTPPKAALSPADVEITPARGSFYAPVYQSLCGTGILADSWVAIWCVSSTDFPLTPSICLQKHPDLTNYFYFLDRNGHWLLWGVQGGG